MVKLFTILSSYLQDYKYTREYIFKLVNLILILFFIYYDNKTFYGILTIYNINEEYKFMLLNT